MSQFWKVLAVALGALIAPVTGAWSQGADCVGPNFVGSEVTELQRQIGFDNPDGRPLLAYAASNAYRARAAMRAMFGSFASDKTFAVLESIYLLEQADGSFLVLFGEQGVICGFAKQVALPRLVARVGIRAAEAVRANEADTTLRRYPGSRALEQLYQLAMNVHPSQPSFPTDICAPLSAAELRQVQQAGQFRGETLRVIADGASQPRDLLFHILGPDRFENLSWTVGLLLRERGDRTDIIIATGHDMACGFDGQVSFPTAQVNTWLDTPPNRGLHNETGLLIFWTEEQEQLRANLLSEG